MKVAHAPAELERRPRAVAIGDLRRRPPRPSGAWSAQVLGTGLVPTVVTFDPHPREVLGYDVELLSTLERRLELLAELGVEETLVVEFTPELAALDAGGVRRGVRARARGRARRRRRGVPLRRAAGAATCETFERLGVEARDGAARPGRLVDADPPARSAPATSARRRRCSDGRSRSRGSSSAAMPAAARSGSRPRTSGSTARCSSRGSASTPGAALDHRAAISIGVNPHYGGAERRIEAFLLDFEGDLYGQRVVVELWERLRDEAVFESEAELDRADRARRRGDARRDASVSGRGQELPEVTRRRCTLRGERGFAAHHERLAGHLARAGEEGRRRSDEPALPRGARGGALPRVDRRAGPARTTT